jgi:hypothetical protein
MYFFGKINSQIEHIVNENNNEIGNKNTNARRVAVMGCKLNKYGTNRAKQNITSIFFYLASTLFRILK